MTQELDKAIEWAEIFKDTVFYSEDDVSPVETILEALRLARDGGWRDIKSAPKDGTLFECLIDGLPYYAKYDEYGRFIRYRHTNIGEGAKYKIHYIDGKRLLEEVREQEYNYQKLGSIWTKGFDHKPTHWKPITPPSEE